MWQCISKWQDPQCAGKSFRVSVALERSTLKACRLFVAFLLEVVAFAASRYEFQDINGLRWIKWWLSIYLKYLVWFSLILRRLCHIAPWNDPIHSQQVIVTSFIVSVALGWFKDAYMGMNKVLDVISIDVPTLWYCLQNGCIHRDLSLYFIK